MNEAPKILWYDDQECSAGPVQFNTDEVKYIRADLVNGLVEALEEMTELNRVYWKAIAFEPSVGGTFQEVLDKARAALKAMEEQQ
jgi:hypothetical protein